jgi:DNA repair protein RecO (recombination protein O)
MTRRETEAIVLSVETRGENDLRVVLLSAQGELIDAHAPAAKRSQRRFGAALQPATRIRARWTQRREGAGAILDEAVALGAPPHPDPLERLYASAHLVELLSIFGREGQSDPHLYRLLAAALGRLDQGDAVGPLARYVEGWLLRLAGWMPDLTCCATCGAPLTQASVALAAERGAFCERDAPPGSARLGREAINWLIATERHAPDRLPPLSAPAQRELAELLMHWIEGFAGRSLKAWRGWARLTR